MFPSDNVVLYILSPKKDNTNVVGGRALTRNRLNEGLPREGGVRRSPQEGKEDTCWFTVIEERPLRVLLEDIGFISDWGTYEMPCRRAT